MIIIFSNSEDHSTSYVIDWLDYFNIEYLRVNSISDIEIVNYNSNNNAFIFKYKKWKINSYNITGFWYRRGLISIKNISLSKDLIYNSKLNNFLRTEKETLYNFFVSSLERNCKNSIGGYFKSDYNKLFQLEIAKKCGLKIPGSFILNS